MTDRLLPLRIILPVALLLLFSVSLLAQNVNGRFSSSLYGWERYDSVGGSGTVLLGMQNFQVNVKQGDITLSTSVYGTTKLTDSFGDGAELRVRNLFAMYRNQDRSFELKLGRVPVFAGVGVGAVDGGLFRARMFENRIRLTGYGGSNVPSSLVYDHNRDIDKNFLMGAQVTGELTPETRLGLSYVNRRIERAPYETFRPDSLFNPVAVIITPDSRATQRFGVDISHRSSGVFDLYGRYDYDINLERTLRGELNGRAYLTSDLTFLANFIYREPSVPFNSFFTIFPVSSIREYEGGIEYRIARNLRASARFAYVGYASDMSRRLTVGLTADFVSLSYSGSNGYAGELSSFYLRGMYPLFDRMVIPTVSAAYSSYRLETGSPDETMFTTALGGIFRPMSRVSFDIQVQILNNRWLDNDVRGFFKVSYWFNHNLGIL